MLNTTAPLAHWVQLVVQIPSSVASSCPITMFALGPSAWAARSLQARLISRCIRVHQGVSCQSTANLPGCTSVNALWESVVQAHIKLRPHLAQHARQPVAACPRSRFGGQ